MSLKNDYIVVCENLKALSNECNQVNLQHTYISQKIDEIERLFIEKIHYYNCYLDNIEKKLNIAAISQNTKGVGDDLSQLDEFIHEIKEILIRIDEDIDNKLLIFQQNMKNMAIEFNMSMKKKVEKLKCDLEEISMQYPMEMLSITKQNDNESPYQTSAATTSSYSRPEVSNDVSGDQKYFWPIDRIYEKFIKEINCENSCLLSPQIFQDVMGYNYRLSIYLNGYPDYPSYQKYIAIRCRAERDADNIDLPWPTNKLITVVIKNQRNNTDRYSFNDSDICRTVDHSFQMPGDFLWMDQVVSISEVFGHPPYSKQTDYTLNNQLLVSLVFHN